MDQKFSSPEADPQKIREDLKNIIKGHDDSIIGSAAR